MQLTVGIAACIAAACAGGSLPSSEASPTPSASLSPSPTPVVTPTPTPADAAVRWRTTAEPWFLDGEMLRSFGGDGVTPSAVFSTPACDPFYQALQTAEAFESTLGGRARFHGTSTIAGGYTSAFLTTDTAVWASEDLARQVFDLEVIAQAAHTRGACLRALMLNTNPKAFSPRGASAHG